MPYLPTTQAFLEQSALLLEAYPDTTRITTKYSFPSQRPSNQKKLASPDSSKPQDQSTTPSAPIATLILKTYNPTSGICLKYRTNKAAEVGRLVTSLGKLAGGANVASLGLSAPAPGQDVEMTDAPAVIATEETAGKTEAGKGGKAKKKGGKGKR